MTESRLMAQLRRDSEAVAKLSERVRESYSREFQGTVDRGAFYSFSGSDAARKVK